MPQSPLAAPATLSSAAPGYCALPARTPTTPRVYFCASGPRAAAAAQRRPRAGAPRPPAVGQSRPMSTRWTTPHTAAAGSTRCATLWVPNVTVTAAVTCGPSSSPVSTSTPLGVSTATTGIPASSRSACSASRRRPGRPPIPTIPSTTTSGRAGSPAMVRPPACSQRADAALVRVLGQQPRLDLDAAPGEQRAGVQRVAAVVARPDQQQRPAPVRRPEQVDHGVRQPGRGPLHQRPLGQPRHQLRLGRPHLLDRVRAPHAAHAIGERVVCLRTAYAPFSGTRPVHLWMTAPGLPAPGKR